MNSMSSGFLELARTGRTQWWRFILGILIVLVSWVVAGAALGVGVVLYGLWTRNPQVHINSATYAVEGVDPFVSYLMLNFGHVVLMIALYLVVRRLHRRPFLSLVTAADRVDWKRVWQGFGWWSLLLFVATLVDYALHPSAYQVSLKLERFLLFLPVVLILTPIQTSAEELLCRGYLLQGFGLLTHNRWVLSGIIGILFMLPHLGNPEVVTGFWPMAAYYFGVGVFLTLVTLKSNSLELAMGVHAATCLFNAVICNYAHSVLETESIFFTTVLEPYSNLVAFVVMALVFYWVLLVRPQSGVTGDPSKTEDQPIELLRP
jgi:uncharacterized protein